MAGALAMLDALAGFNAARRAAGLSEVRVSIGQNSVAPNRIDQGARLERVQERRHGLELYAKGRCDRSAYESPRNKQDE